MKQKTLFFIAGFLSITAITVQAQEKFTITGKLSGLKGHVMIHLRYKTAQGLLQDSMLSNNGAFTFKGVVKEPLEAQLYIYGPPASVYKSLVIEKGKITVAGDSLLTATIKGGKIQADYASLQSQLWSLWEKQSEFYKTWAQYRKEKNLTAMDEVHTQQLNAIQAAIKKIEDGYISTHPDNEVSLFTLQRRSYNLDPNIFEPLFNRLSQRLRNTEAGKEITGFIALAKKTTVGQPAGNFTQNNPDGAPVSLSSLKGKYVLIDFWASWCAPCRAENPNVVKAYQKFKGSNFEIIAVSLDKAKEPWLKAIKDDGLSWIQVSDLNYWENAVALEYGIRSIPQNLLLDPNGIIIAKNLRGEALEKKLEEIFPH